MNEPIAIVEQREKQVKKFKVGPIESDSGNHLLDIGSVFIGILALMVVVSIIQNVGKVIN